MQTETTPRPVSRPVVGVRTGERRWSTVTPDGREVVIRQDGSGTYSDPVDGTYWTPVSP